MSLASSQVNYWFKKLSAFVSLQIVIQAVGLLSSILVVRLLTQQQYAYYTIANSMQATLSILSDMGISSGLLAIGGEVWQDKSRFSQLIVTAIKLRYYFASIVIVIFIPIMIWLFVKNEASVIETVLLICCVVLGFIFQLSNTVFNTVLKLYSQVGKLQKLELVLATIRIALLGLSCLIFLNATVAIFVTSISLGLRNILLKRWIVDRIDFEASANQEYQQKILGIVTKQSPQAIFYSIQGQITIFLISFFGSTNNIAEVGAIGRLSVIFSVIGSAMANIILPGFARCQRANLLRRRYFQIMSILVLIVLFIIVLALIFPDYLLWIFGSKYSHLRNVVFLVVANAGLQYIVKNMWQINTSKGWVEYAWFNMPSTILVQIVLLFFLDVSTVKGIIMFNMLSILPFLLINIFTTYHHLYKPKSN